ncbi:MAG TPA: sialidase family protein, partial [Thermoanaerobaculia bacterium]
MLLSWLEPVQEKRYSLKFASYEKGSWSEARTIVTRDDFFVNWADFPSIVADARGTLFAHWLQKNGEGPYAYDVRVTSSSDGGRTWRPSRALNTDGKQAEHGFVSMVPRERGGVAIVWLDGREMKMDDSHGHAGAMTVRYANLDAALQASGETVLDPRVCECCTTAMTMTASGPVVAYRDRSEEEIRDISFTRLLPSGRWSVPRLVNRDDWKINGCPVNGPQLDARGRNAVMAWFTSGGGQPKVNVAFSKDAGASFEQAIRVDGGKPTGRVDVQLLRDGSAL